MSRIMPITPKQYDLKTYTAGYLAGLRSAQEAVASLAFISDAEYARICIEQQINTFLGRRTQHVERILIPVISRFKRYNIPPEDRSHHDEVIWSIAVSLSRQCREPLGVFDTPRVAQFGWRGQKDGALFATVTIDDRHQGPMYTYITMVPLGNIDDRIGETLSFSRDDRAILTDRGVIDISINEDIP